MANTVTVTAKQAGGVTVTAKLIPNVLSFSVDTTRQLLTVLDNNDFRNNYDISAATTMTVTISGGTYAVVVS